MDIFISKLLPVFAYPLGLATLLGVFAFLFLGRWRRMARLALFVALAVLWVASTPAFSQWILWQLESRHPAVPLAELPDASVAIVLGGAIGQPIPPRAEPDLLESVDRVVDAARLYRAGKVTAILVTAGNLPWQTSAKPEAELIADFLVELGVPRDAIAVETESRNTFENAANTVALFRARGWTDGLLLTSAFHMPRAYETFARNGWEGITPWPVDFRSGDLAGLRGIWRLDRNLLGVNLALKEYLGTLVYRMTGK